MTASLPSCKVEPKDTMPENEPNQQADYDSHIESADDSIQAGEAESEVIVQVQSEEQENSKETSSNEGEPESLDFSTIVKDNLSIEERDRIIFQIHDLYPGRKFAQKRIDILNEADILFNGRQWVKKDFSDQLCRARQRMKIQQRN